MTAPDEVARAALAEGRLTAQRCSACASLRWPPASRCPQCLSPAADWVDLARRGTLWSYTVYHRAFSPAYRDQVPYAVGLIELDDGPRIYARLNGDPTALRSSQVGAPVRLAVGPVADEPIVVFELIG